LASHLRCCRRPPLDVHGSPTPDCDRSCAPPDRTVRFQQLAWACVRYPCTTVCSSPHQCVLPSATEYRGQKCNKVLYVGTACALGMCCCRVNVSMRLMCLATKYSVHVKIDLAKPVCLCTESPSVAHKRSSSQGTPGKFLSRSAGQNVSHMPTAAPQGDQHMVYTVPADRQAFMRQSTTTDCGQSETIGSSTSGNRVSALSGRSSMGQEVPSAHAALHPERTLRHPGEAAEPRGASFDEFARCALSTQMRISGNMSGVCASYIDVALQKASCTAGATAK
jgi:hypothetical protein